MRRHHSIAALVVALLALFVLAACGRGNDSIEATAVPAVRTPIPTFTPTNLPENQRTQVETAAPAPAAEVAAPAAAANAAAPVVAATLNQPGVGGPMDAQPVAPLQPVAGTINIELVNSRSGPDTSHPVVIVLGRGEEYDITGKTADGLWVRICCIEQKEVWMSAEFITAAGPLDALPVAQAGETSGLTDTGTAPDVAETSPEQPATVAEAPAPASEAATVEPVAVEPVAQPMAAATASEVTDASAAAAVSAAGGDAAAGSLLLTAQEQFPENQVVRVFLFIYQGTDALEGYTAQVTKDGQPQAASIVSFGGRPGLTWPIADERQRFQNLKVEFPGVAIAGVWAVTPLKDGVAAGPTATFTLREGDTTSELYVRYALP